MQACSHELFGTEQQGHILRVSGQRMQRQRGHQRRRKEGMPFDLEIKEDAGTGWTCALKSNEGERLIHGAECRLVRAENHWGRRLVHCCECRRQNLDSWNLWSGVAVGCFLQSRLRTSYLAETERVLCNNYLDGFHVETLSP